MDRRAFLELAGAGVVSLLLPRLGFPAEAATSGGRKPNVVLILADDLGYADLGCYGGREIPTPHIDALAAGGIRFTDGYVSCPLCSPTRAGLMTGKYQQRFGHEFNPGPQLEKADIELGLALSQKTIADHFKAAGYVTGMFGKWHLGAQPEFLPTKRGFDEFYGFLGGMHSYMNLQETGPKAIHRGNQPVVEKDYLTDALAREAAAFIDRHQKEPFFLYLPFNAVHVPLQAPQKYLDRFKSITGEKRRTYAAMLSAMDDGIGVVVQKLREAGLEENTLIIFLSDNGGPTGSTTSRNDPFRGGKAGMFEGGIRIPFVVQWKGRLPAGKVYRQPIISLDILPTALAAAGQTAPADLDGINLLPFLSAAQPPAQPPHERLFWRMGDNGAVRQGKWKLVKTGAAFTLYDLEADTGERSNLASREPAVFKELQEAWTLWDKQLASPNWQPGGHPPATGPATQPAATRPARAARRAARRQAATQPG